MIGPALNAGFTHLDFKWGGYIEVNEWTAGTSTHPPTHPPTRTSSLGQLSIHPPTYLPTYSAGWMMVLPNLLCGLGFLLLFQEPKPVAVGEEEEEEEEEEKQALPTTQRKKKEEKEIESGNGRPQHHASKRLRRHVLWAQGGLW